MAGETTGYSAGIFPGWFPNRNLQDLVQLIEPTPRLAPTIREDNSSDRPTGIQGGPLLAGRSLQIHLGSAKTKASSGESEPLQATTVTQFPVSTKPARSHRGILVKLALLLLVVVGLVVFAWVVMKSSDYSDIIHVEGERFESDQLAVELGQTLPSFSGLLLVDNLEEWGDTFSDQDLVGKNTVLFVWGSLNEELVSWSQDLNYIRLVNFEGKNVQFLGLNLDKNRDEALSALNEDLAKWPHLFNGDERKAQEERPMFRLGVRSSPLILLIDATGRLRAEGLGPGEVVEAYRKLFE